MADLLRRARAARRPAPAPAERGDAPPPSLATMADVDACYRLLLEREPDDEGYRGYQKAVREGVPRRDLVESFLTSAEFRQRRGGVGAASGEQATTPELVELDGGMRLWVSRDDWAVGRPIAEHRTYEPHVLRQLLDALVPGSAFVDVGANIGFFTIAAARALAASGGVVRAIEPNPDSCRLVHLSAAANGLGNVEVLPLAASDHRGLAGYFDHGSNGELGPLATEPGAGSDARPVPVLPLDEIVPATPAVSVVKVDVEGAEGLVFRGAGGLLARDRPVLLFELAPERLRAISGVDAADLLGSLLGLGYEVAILPPAPCPAGELDFSVDAGATLAAVAAADGHSDLLARPRS